MCCEAYDGGRMYINTMVSHAIWVKCFFYSLKFSILECLVDVTTSLLSLIKRGVSLYLRSSGKCDIQV